MVLLQRSAALYISEFRADRFCTIDLVIGTFRIVSRLDLTDGLS